MRNSPWGKGGWAGAGASLQVQEQKKILEMLFGLVSSVNFTRDPRHGRLLLTGTGPRNP